MVRHQTGVKCIHFVLQTMAHPEKIGSKVCFTQSITIKITILLQETQRRTACMMTLKMVQDEGVSRRIGTA